MKITQTSLCAVAALALANTASAVIVTEATRVFTVGVDIADLQDPPAVFLQTITDSAIQSITRVEVGLKLKGTTPGSGFASEMFVSLNKDLGPTSILLNQAGVTVADSIGVYYDGWDVTFSDAAANGDIHFATLDSGVLGGTWAPDGRADATGADRFHLLDVFNGGTGNGDWRLAIGDLALGGLMSIESWSITLTGDTQATSVPDGGATALLLAMGLGGMAWARSRQKTV